MHSRRIQGGLLFLFGIAASVYAKPPVKLGPSHNPGPRFVVPNAPSPFCQHTAQEVFEKSAKECGGDGAGILFQSSGLPSTAKPDESWKPRSLLDSIGATHPLQTLEKSKPAAPELRIDYPALLRLYRVGLECPEESRFGTSFAVMLIPKNADPRVLQLRAYFTALKKATDSSLRAALAEELDNFRSEILAKNPACHPLPPAGAESRQLTARIESFHRKLQGKTLKQHADLYQYADPEEKALLDLLFQPTGGVSIEFLLGPERANYYRGILVNGPIAARTQDGATLDPKSPHYLLASKYLGRGVPEAVPALLKQLADWPVNVPDAQAKLTAAFGGAARDAGAERGYLQEVLAKIERGMNARSVRDKIVTEKIRTYLHAYLASLDGRTVKNMARFLPDQTAALLSEGGKNQIEHVDPKSLRAGASRSFGLPTKENELQALYGVRNVPDEQQRLEMATLDLTHDEFRNIERRMEVFSRSAQRHLREVHEGRTGDYFYGRELAEERKKMEPGVFKSGPLDKITEAMGRRGLGLSPEERLRFHKALRPFSQELLAQMIQFATDRKMRGAKGRLQYSPSFEDLVKIIFSPEGKNDLIQAYAAMARDPGIEDKIMRAPILHRLKFPPGIDLRPGARLDAAQSADLAHQAEDLLVTGELNREDKDALALFARILRERNHEPETLYRDLQPSEVAQHFSSPKYAETIASRRWTRQAAQKMGEAGKTAMAAADDVAKTLTQTGFGFPLLAQSALDQFLMKTGDTGVSILKQLRAGMKPEAFAKLMGGLDPPNVENDIFGALHQHLPYSHYLMADGGFQLEQLQEKAHQELLKDGKLSDESKSFLSTLVVRHPECLDAGDDEQIRDCLERTLYLAAGELMIARGQLGRVDALLAKVIPDANERAAHIKEIGLRAKRRSENRALGDGLGVSLEQTLALGRGAMDQQTEAERARQKLASDWAQQEREALQGSVEGKTLREAELAEVEREYQKLAGQADLLEKTRRRQFLHLTDAEYKRMMELKREAISMQRPGGGEALKASLESHREKIRHFEEQAALSKDEWKELVGIREQIEALTKNRPKPRYGRDNPAPINREASVDMEKLRPLKEREQALLRKRKLPAGLTEEAEIKMLQDLDQKMAMNRHKRKEKTNANRDGALTTLAKIQNRLDPLRQPNEEFVSSTKRITVLLSQLATLNDKDSEEKSELRKRFHGEDLQRLEDLWAEYEAMTEAFGETGELVDKDGNPIDEAKLQDFNNRMVSAFFDHGNQMYGDPMVAATATKLKPFLKDLEGVAADKILDLPQRVQNLIALCKKEPCGVTDAELDHLKYVYSLHQAAPAGGADRLDRPSQHERAEDESRVKTEAFVEMQTLRKQLLSSARSYDHDNNTYLTEEAFENLIKNKARGADVETKEKLFKQQIALNRDLLRGKALADVIARSTRHNPLPADASPETLNQWLAEAGFDAMVKNWRFGVTSGGKDYKASPKELDALFVKMLREAHSEAETRSKRKAEIEKTLAEIVPPTGKRLAGSGLWDWDQAKLHRVASGDSEPKGDQIMSQAKFRELLNEYAELSAAEEHALDRSYQVNGRGEDELHDHIDQALARNQYRRSSTAVNLYSVVTPMHRAGQKPKYEFRDFEKLKPEFEERTKKLWERLANNGELMRAIAKKGDFVENFDEVMLNMNQIPGHLQEIYEEEGALTLAQKMATEASPWHRTGYGKPQYEMKNERKVEELSRELISGISELNALGDAVIKVNGLKTRAADEAQRLRAAYQDLLVADRSSNDRRMGNQNMIEEGAIAATSIFIAPYALAGITAEAYAAARWAKLVRNGSRIERAVSHASLALAAIKKGEEAGEGYWHLAKAYNFGRNSIGMAKNMTIGALTQAGMEVGLKQYFNVEAARRADTVDKLGKDCKPGSNGIPDWRDALQCGMSYRDLPKDADSDGNGIPDYYDYAEFGASAERYTMGSMKMQYDGLKSSAAMGMMMPLASAFAGKFFLRPLANLIRGEQALAGTVASRVRAAVPMYLQTFDGQVGTTGVKLLQGESLLGALWGSAFMTPIDDWAVIAALKHNPKLSPGAITAIKRVFNHGVDGLQGAVDVWTKGKYTTGNGVETDDTLTAILWGMSGSAYLSDKASRGGQAQMDMVPRLVVEDLRRESRAGGTNLRSELLDYELEVGRDPSGKPVTRRVRDIVTNGANLEDFNSPKDYQAFITIFSEKLKQEGIPEHQIAKAYTKAINKTSKLELGFGEVSDLIGKMVREEKLRRVVDGEAPANTILDAANDVGYAYKAHHYLSGSDALSTKKTVQKLVSATAKDFGLDPADFAAYIKKRHDADPDVTSALTLRSMAQDMIKAKRKGSLGLAVR